MKITILLALGALAIPAAGTASAAGSSEDRVYRILDQAKQKAGKVPAQARALVELAWPPSGADADREVMAAARRNLLEFGEDGLRALREAVPTVDPIWQADVVATFVEARYQARSGMPRDYLPGLEEAIWFGSAEARRIAILEISRYTFPQAVNSTVDAVYEHPWLAVPAMRSLGAMGDFRARHFLEDVLVHGRPEYTAAAAEGLAALGGQTLNVLREHATAPRSATRQAAMRALLPHAGTDDLTRLHEYPLQFPDDAPDFLGEVRNRAAALESELSRELDGSAASGDGAP